MRLFVGAEKMLSLSFVCHTAQSAESTCTYIFNFLRHVLNHPKSPRSALPPRRWQVHVLARECEDTWLHQATAATGAKLEVDGCRPRGVTWTPWSYTVTWPHAKESDGYIVKHASWICCCFCSGSELVRVTWPCAKWWFEDAWGRVAPPLCNGLFLSCPTDPWTICKSEPFTQTKKTTQTPLNKHKGLGEGPNKHSIKQHSGYNMSSYPDRHFRTRKMSRNPGKWKWGWVQKGIDRVRWLQSPKLFWSFPFGTSVGGIWWWKLHMHEREQLSLFV